VYRRQTVGASGEDDIDTSDTAKIEREADRVEESTTPPTPVIYETVRRNGDEEMSRPPWSLARSGVAAGLSISFSLFAQATLRQYLPDAPWRELVAAMGYPVCCELVLKPRRAVGRGLCSDFASGKNPDPQPWVVSSSFFHPVGHRPTRYGSVG
jgi:hypothetical protein